MKSTIFIFLLLVSCSSERTVFLKKERYEIECATNNEMDVHLKRIYIPFQQFSDYGMSAHYEYIWISKKSLNQSILLKSCKKQDLIDLLNRWNSKFDRDYQKFRIPTEWEVNRFKISSKNILTIEDFEKLEYNAQISERIFIVKTYLGVSSNIEF
jgi:hypothetical protein